MERSFDAVSRQDAEQEKERIVLENVRMMNTAMLREIASESFGGNGGAFVVDGREYPCAGANLIVERMTGRMVAFGNMRQPKPGQSAVVLRIAVDIRREQPFFRVVGTSYGSRLVFAARPGSHPDDLLDAHAVDVLQRSIDEWNTLQEIDITET